MSCAIHHGGAGTTAASIRSGIPTIAVPFFSDQFFWGSMIARMEAGPRPIPYQQLTVPELVAAVKTALDPRIQQNSVELGRRVTSENGCLVGAAAFHQHLRRVDLRCNIDATRAAVWRVQRSNLKLSSYAAVVLVESGLLKYNELKL